MVDFLNNLGLWNLVFLVLTFLSFILSIYLHRKSSNVSQPIFDSNSNRLLQNKIKGDGDLKIFYKEQRVDTITETKFAFWNDGKRVINASDVAPKDPLCIEFKAPSLILKSEVLYTTNAINNFQIIPNSEKGTIEISFDYLAQDEGAIIAILHASEEEDSLKLKGTVKGVKNIARYNHKKERLINWAFDKFLFWLDPLMSVIPKRIDFVGFFIAIAGSMPIIFIFGIPQLIITFFNRFLRKKSLLDKYNLTR